jgi:peptide/nickel transport system substrate-binding protein
LPHIKIAEGGYEALAPVMLMEINCVRPPLDDKRVRQAIAYAIDRKFITENIWYGFGKPAVGPISSVFSGAGLYTKEGVRSFDVKDRIDIANKLLDEAGHKRGADGTRFKIIHDVAAFGEDYRRMGEYFKQALARVGITVELRNRDSGTIIREVYINRDFDIVSGWFIGMADPTLGVQRQYWSEMIKPGVPYCNTGHYINPEVDKLWVAAQTELDPAKRATLFHGLQRQIVEDSPVIWIMEMALVSVQNTRVQNLITSPLGVRGGLYDTWIKQ